jgi:hypothetical protein
MITKKTFALTFSLVFSAILLSHSYFISVLNDPSDEVDFSAFSHLTENVKTLASTSRTDSSADVIANEKNITKEIINVIDNEISHNIKRSRLAIREIKIKKLMAEKEKTQALAAIKVKSEYLKKAPELTSVSSVDLSVFEINNHELITLYAFSNEGSEYSKFIGNRLALNDYKENRITENKVYKDEVVTTQASTEAKASAPIEPVKTIGQSESDEVKTIQPSVVRDESKKEVGNEKVLEIVKEEEIKDNGKESDKESDKDEEMVMYDYSDKKPEVAVKKTMDQKLYERPISETVKKAISREIGSTPIKKPELSSIQHFNQPAGAAFVDAEKIDLNSEENVIYDYSNDNAKKPLATQINEAESLLSAPTVNTHETQFLLKAKEVNLNTHKLRQAHAFEFVPDYDRAERTDDQTSGEIVLKYSLSGEMNTQTGTVQAQGMIPTRVELNLGSTEGLEVPLINEEGIQSFLQKQGLSVEGNLLMIALNSSIADIEIDSTFGAKFYFDKSFKLKQTMSGASYALFAGVKTGNILIRYLLSDKDNAQKIVYVGDGEMYFEDPGFSTSSRETFTLTTRNLMAQKKKELVINGDSISFFNTKIQARKKALNAYEIKVPALVSGMRKYLEFKHLKDSIFVGFWNEKEAEIPGNDFIAKVLEVNQVNSLKDRCVVQINLSKDIRELKVNGKNRNGEMFVETSFLDRDGNFSTDNSELAEKAFVTGDMEGLLNVKLDYTDGSTEFLKTFCSEGTYLVEQL